MRKLLCLRKKIWLRAGYFAGFLLFCLLSVALNCKQVDALEISMPIALQFASGSIDLNPYGSHPCSGYHGNGLACGNDPGGVRYTVDGLSFNVQSVAKYKPILVSFSYVVRATSSEAYSGIGSGPGFVVIDQSMTHVGDQFHGSVLALMGASTNGSAMGYSATSYNATNAFSILINEASGAEITGTTAGGGISDEVKQYLYNISWNSTQTQTKLEAIITTLGTIQGDIGTIAWNSTETQKKLEDILEKLDNINGGNSKVEEAIKDQTQAEQDRWDQENNKAEEAINSSQDTGAEGSDEQAKNSLNLIKTILETPAGSCTLPEISAFGFSLGELNLCTYQPPSWIQQVMGAVITIVLAGASIKCTVRVLETLGHAYGGTR